MTYDWKKRRFLTPQESLSLRRHFARLTLMGGENKDWQTFKLMPGFYTPETPYTYTDIFDNWGIVRYTSDYDKERAN